MLVYELNNPNDPLLKFVNAEIEECLIGFFTVKDQYVTIFTLRSDSYLYEIHYDRRTKSV